LLISRRRDLEFQPESMGERLAGHFERPGARARARLIIWPFIPSIRAERQWAEI
jgi:hypothetical protein